MDPALRLRASPAFAFALMPDGRPFVAQECEPYLQYWLSERECRLWSAFATRRGATVDEGLRALPAGARTRAMADLRGMVEAGVLVPRDGSASRYDEAIVEPYLTHRPFPTEICDDMAQRSGLQSGRRVLDLAGGPGDLALQLARRGAKVTLMDWSGAFLASARRRARAEGVALDTLHESCNRLVRDDARYGVVTVSQALHWLDDVSVCRGVLRVLDADGHFFVVHSAFDVPDSHPLAHVLGRRSVLGAKVQRSFGAEVQALHDRVERLLQAIDSRSVERVDPTQADAMLPGLASTGVTLYRQQRELGLGFLRGLLTPRHLADAGLDPTDFWRDAQARCRGARADALIGTHDWALLHFARGAGRARRVAVKSLPVRTIGCTAPVSPVGT
jgi:ubiquinone/menaquinone biosynthesis C-methylase UbiE